MIEKLNDLWNDLDKEFFDEKDNDESKDKDEDDI